MDRPTETDETSTSRRTAVMQTPPIVSPPEWQAAGKKLLVKEKELTRARDALAAERRRMPWMAVEKDYRFEGPSGPASLPDLFEGRRQLIVYRAFYAPDVTTYPASGGAYPERACPFWCGWRAAAIGGSWEWSPWVRVHSFLSFL